jgi:putative transposase
VCCPSCRSTAVQERPERTAQGYRRFRCLDCTKQFNERSSGLLNRTQYPSDVIALVVLWRLRYKLSLRDLAEMFLIRGFVFSYEAVRDWEAKLTPALAEELRRSRKGKVGRSWYTDETYIRVHGRWKYLYRAIDRDGALVDVMLSEHRNLAAAKRFFRSAKAVTGVITDRVTTDGHDAYPRAIRLELGSCVWHRTNSYLNNRLEQDHRGIKGRWRPMLGFKSVPSARRYCRGYDNSGTFCALVLACASTLPPLHGAFTTCAGQPSLSVCWKLLERGFRSPRMLLGTGSKLTQPHLARVMPAFTRASSNSALMFGPRSSGIKIASSWSWALLFQSRAVSLCSEKRRCGRSDIRRATRTTARRSRSSA